MGIDKYNAACRAIVMRYSGEWRRGELCGNRSFQLVFMTNACCVCVCMCMCVCVCVTSCYNAVITRVGRWIDFDNDYKTMNLSFSEFFVCLFVCCCWLRN